MNLAELPNTDDIRADLEYMTARWGDIPGGAAFEVRAFKEHTQPHTARFSPDRIDEAVDWIRNMNDLGRNLYVVRNPIRPDVVGSASDTDIIAAFFLWADCDDMHSAENIRKFTGPKFSASVVTGKVPETRVHVYWQLTEPMTDMQEWTRIQQGIAAHFNSDKSVVNPSRIMRIAGTVAYPAKHKQERGYVEELTTFRNSYDDAREPVSIDQMQRVFASAAPQPAPQSGMFALATGDSYGPALDAQKSLSNALQGEGWNKHVNELVWRFAGLGASDEEILTLAPGLTLPGYTVDQTRAEMATMLKYPREQGIQPKEQDRHAAPTASPQLIADFRIKSSADFLSDLAPLEYLIEGILPSGVVYSLTGYPGHGKTTLAIQVGLAVALGEDFAGRETEAGDVLFLAGENPYNLKWQYAAALAARDIGPPERMHFVEGHFSIAAMIETLKAKMLELPNLKLVIIDSLQAFFEGDDDNANIRMVEAARQFREVGNIGSRPAVAVIAHPAGKEPRKDNLVPRGGGAFLAEIDGNLTVWGHGEDMQTLHHSPKFRGAGFEPIDFVMGTHEFAHLTDSKGKPLRLKVSRQALQIEQMTRADRHETRLKDMLEVIAGNSRATLREIEQKAGISKSAAGRLIKEAVEEKLISRHAKGWRITQGGEDYLNDE
jgi:hypothetical protein